MRPHRSPARHRGFTLIEVMVTVAIVGILATIAYPAYADYVLRGRLVDATNALSSLQTRMEQHYQDNRTYASTAAAASPCANAQSAGAFTIDCPTLTAATYTLRATGSGQTAGFVYTLTHQDTRGSTMASRWGGGTYTCWIMKKGETC